MNTPSQTILVNKAYYKALIAFVRDVRKAVVVDKSVVKSPDFVADDAEWFAEKAKELLARVAAL